MLRDITFFILSHVPLIRCVKLRVAHAPKMLGTFSPPPRFNDSDMHHGTCVTHVPWYMSGSPTSGFLWSRWREKHSRHSRRMCKPQCCVSGKRRMVSMLLAGWPRVFLAPGHLQQLWWLGPADPCHECPSRETVGTQWNFVFKSISICCKMLQWIRIETQRVSAQAQQLQLHLVIVMINKLLAPVCFFAYR